MKSFQKFLFTNIKITKFSKIKKFDFFKTCVRDIFDSKLEKKLFEDLEQKVQFLLSTISQKEFVGILAFTGLPCMNYSSLQGLNLKRESMIDPSKFLARQNASDFLVEKALVYFERFQKVCQHHFSVSGRVVHSAIVVENPWSVESLRIPFSKKIYLKKKRNIKPFWR